MGAKLYAVVNEKGGVGKTTLAMNLAAGLARRGECIVVDADPQGSATLWAHNADARRRFPAEVTAGPHASEQTLSRLGARCDYIVVDCPPAAGSPVARRVASLADALLIPVLPSPMDLWASTRIEETVTEARQYNPGLRAYIVVNQIDARNAMSRAIGAALAELSVPVMRTGLGRRACYRTSALEGCSVYDLGYRGREACKEIDAIIEEVLGT